MSYCYILSLYDINSHEKKYLKFPQTLKNRYLISKLFFINNPLKKEPKIQKIFTHSACPCKCVYYVKFQKEILHFIKT